MGGRDKHYTPPQREHALAIGIERDTARLTDVPARSGTRNFEASRLTPASLAYTGAAQIRLGLPVKTAVNRDLANSGPGPDEGVGRKVAICKRYNTNLCQRSAAECKHAHVCFHCVDWDNPHGAHDCNASLEEIEQLQDADTDRAHSPT